MSPSIESKLPLLGVHVYYVICYNLLGWVKKGTTMIYIGTCIGLSILVLWSWCAMDCMKLSLVVIYYTCDVKAKHQRKFGQAQVVICIEEIAVACSIMLLKVFAKN